MNQHLYSTELKDRILWFDGDSSFSPKTIYQHIKRLGVKWVTHLTPTIEQYNKYATIPIKVKTECRPWSLEWNIPDKYKELSVMEYVLDKHIDLTKNMPEPEIEARDRRLVTELLLFDEKGLFDVLRTIIYIINTLETTNKVWGVGRGSSVASYVLYVIGVHDIDSFRFNLPIEEFLHE